MVPRPDAVPPGGREAAAPLTAADGPAPGGLAGAVWLAVLALVGIGDAVYLTFDHYAHVAVLCPSSGVVNCSLVLSSQYSVVPGTTIPITIPGIAFLLVSLLLALAQYRRPRQPDLRRAHFAWAGLGLLAVFYLVFVEVVELKAICLFCTGVHLVLVLTLVTTAWRLRPPEPARTAP